MTVTKLSRDSSFTICRLEILQQIVRHTKIVIVLDEVSRVCENQKYLSKLLRQAGLIRNDVRAVDMGNAVRWAIRHDVRQNKSKGMSKVGAVEVRLRH